MTQTYSIIQNMNSRLKNTLFPSKGMPESMTRDIGGFRRTNQPYISGYFQVFFDLPEALFANKPNTFTANDNEADSDDNASTSGKATVDGASWLHSTCEGFTAPSQTINKIDIVGQGQIGSSFPASTSITREFTLTFREYQNLPVLNTIRNWGAVFDPHNGVSPLQGVDMVPLNYKGRCYVGLTKPTMGVGGMGTGEGDGEKLGYHDFEEIFFFDGVFPTTVPIDTAGATDITTNESVQHSVTFSFDGFPITKVDSNGQDLVKKMNSLLAGRKYMDTYDTRYKNMNA